MDLLLAFAGLSNVVGGLHSHERVHLHSKGFLDAERHVPGKVSLAVEQAGQRGPGNMKRGRRRRYREACRLDNLRPNEISGMRTASPWDSLLDTSAAAIAQVVAWAVSKTW